MHAERFRRIASGLLSVSAVCFTISPCTSSAADCIPLIRLISPVQQQPTLADNAPPLSLPAQVDLARLVDLAADRLAIGIDYDPAVVKGPAVLRLPGPVHDAELWTILNRVLASRGLTTVRFPGDRAYAVVKITDATAAALTTSATISRPADHQPFVVLPSDAPVPGFQSVLIDLKHRDPTTLVETVTKVLSKSASSVVALGPSKQLLISDLSPRIEQALQLLALLDVPEALTVVERVPVANLGAEQMATLVTQLNTRRKAVAGSDLAGEVVAAPDGISVLVIASGEVQPQWRDLIASLDQREQVITIAYDARQFPAAEVAKFVEASVRDTLDTRWNLVLDTLPVGLW